MLFTCFPQLPPEVRLKIWEAALPESQIIYIFLASTPKSNSPQLVAEASEKDALQSLYFTCKDSHNTLKARYKCYFRDRLQNAVWLDNEIDTLYLEDFSMYTFMNNGEQSSQTIDFKSVRNLAIDIPLLLDTSLQSHSFSLDVAKPSYLLIECFANLKQVAFVESSQQSFGVEVLKQLYQDFKSNYQSWRKESPRQHHDATILDRLEFKVISHKEFNSLDAW
ncbi:hypothetical protein EG329_011531 [Mollisiaceae sp. DMI_Dod_QoI]|nr:hypothetical protein EG329_011531 [Helotiales sp. DMI_Dod_QoI]